VSLVAPDDPGRHLRSRVLRVEVIGNESLVYLDGPGPAPWIARVAADWPGHTGDQVGVRMRTADVLLFATPTGTRLDVALQADAAGAPHEG
jgi:hypothetical protein